MKQLPILKLILKPTMTVIMNLSNVSTECID
jgi:hypothetical protein